MLRLTDALQLEISPVYTTRGSMDQATDATILVLFYTHAALGAGKRYSHAPATGITAMRLTLPAFPTSLISKSRASFFPLPWVRFDGDVQSSSNNVSITYGRLIFLFVASRGLIVKTTHGPTASQRLIREYNAYAAMRTLQGAAIPTVIGMFITKDGKNTVLMMSYAGKALRAFSELEPRDKLTLFHRLVRLHKTGVQHNDLEPRNVAQSPSGPLIIDFDRASWTTTAPGRHARSFNKSHGLLTLMQQRRWRHPKKRRQRLWLYTMLFWSLYPLWSPPCSGSRVVHIAFERLVSLL
ncbi:hypothetical protein C8R44DRAFT_891440 [Mycena epipterygia]|nr:hypothetical protein C8R44DRAFT_891440 [Mycena epipterygia]